MSGFPISLGSFTLSPAIGNLLESEILNSVLNSVRADTQILEAIGTIVERIKKLWDDLDPTFPEAQQTLRGRLKEILPLCCSYVKQWISISAKGASLENSMLSLILNVRAEDPMKQVPETDAALPLPTTKEEFNVFIGKRLTRIITGFFQKNSNLPPLTIEALEDGCKFLHIAERFSKKVLNAAVDGLNEKGAAATDKELEVVKSLRFQNQQFKLFLINAESFVAEERRRDLSDQGVESPEPLNLDLFIAFREACKQLFRPLLDIPGLWDSFILPDAPTAVLAQNCESAFRETERVLNDPQAFENWKIIRLFFHRILSVEQKPQPLSREVLEKYSKDDLLWILTEYAVLSLIPEIAQEFGPVLLKYCRKHILSCQSLVPLDQLLNAFSAGWENYQPKSELETRYQQHMCQMAEKFKKQFQDWREETEATCPVPMDTAEQLPK